MIDFSEPIELAKRRGGPAQLLILHRGIPVVEERYGVGEHAAFWPYSVSKIFLATLTWALHQDGAIEVDAPVARYWPEFAQSRKASVTIRQVLQHRSGLPRVGGTIPEVAAMTNWDESIRRIEEHPREPDADEVPAYEWLSWGFMLGETLQRATGRDLDELLSERILSPIGAENTFLTLPQTEAWREVPFVARDPGSAVVASVLNRPKVREAVIPAGGISTNAHDLARVLEAIRQGGSDLNLSESTVRELLEPSNDGEFDRYAGSKVWWSNGLQLGHEGDQPFTASAFGQRSSAKTFGHNGSNVSVAWSDPTREITFVYLSGILEPFPVNRLRLMAIQDAVVEAVDRAGELRGCRS
ncbi:MAG: serine hydrolase domain-containing protein [Gulosibacter sp.]|uniref:serine hydrolase domain-containing protein n=1 Tax=Gulosibacter sp. TaxID=2817531 RepID=UPI003F8DD9B9